MRNVVKCVLLKIAVASYLKTCPLEARSTFLAASSNIYVCCEGFFMSYNRDGIDNRLSSITFITFTYLLKPIKRLYSENIKIGLPASFDTLTRGPILFLLN